MNRTDALVSLSELESRDAFPPTMVSRGDFFAALFVIACVNGIVPRAIQSANDEGLAAALLSTFDTSVIVLLASCIGIALIFQDRCDNVRNSDLAVGIPLLAMVALPSAAPSWVGVTGLALYIMAGAEQASRRKRGAMILLATSFSMFWSPLLFAFLTKPILDIDAALTAWVKGTPHVGNMVRFADNSGYLVVFPACSSFANVSLALLTWVLVSQSVGHRPSMRDIFWCLLTCAAVIAVNVSRLAIMATDMHRFAMVHNPWGNAIANVIILILIFSISALSVRRELISHV